MPGSDRPDHAALAAAGRVAVYGLGREGQALVRWLRSRFPSVTVEVLVDTLDDAARRAAEALEVPVVAGTDAVVARAADGDLDLVIRSPGVPLRGAGLTAARAAGLPITSGTNLWFEEQEPTNAIVVTGTKGKSTTSALLAHLLTASGRDVALLGNIGHPLLDHEVAASALDLVVIELSSYQLADLHAHIPVGVWLNLHPEHLDWHGSQAAYAADKGRIVDLSRCLVANAADQAVAAACADHPDVQWVDATGDPIVLGEATLARGGLEDAIDGSALVGAHHVGNLAAALTAATTIGVAPGDLLEHVASFTPLPHRLQLVHDDGRRWVDDSIATIPEAAVAALRAFPTVPITLLAGGHDRSQDHHPLVAEIAGRPDVHVVTLPDTGPRLAADLRRAGVERVTTADHLAGAVTTAAAVTPPGGVVLLSPAAPSYGHFTSFEERGDRFAALARQASPPA